MSHVTFVTRADMASDLRRLGLRPGDAALVHGALRSIGPLLGGADSVVGALLDAVSPGGTILVYTDWEARYFELLDGSGRVPAHWRAHVPPFDAATSRASRDNGALPEFLRTWPGARRSGNPGASIAALGADAEWFTADHRLDYGYGPGSPLARLVQARGKVVMLGAPWDTMTLLHHAEHLAEIDGKLVIRYEVPILTAGGATWRMVEEFDTSRPVVAGLAEDYFADIVTEFIGANPHDLGLVGTARTLVVDAAATCDYAVGWLETRIQSNRETNMPKSRGEKDQPAQGAVDA